MRVKLVMICVCEREYLIIVHHIRIFQIKIVRTFVSDMGYTTRVLKKSFLYKLYTLFSSYIIFNIIRTLLVIFNVCDGKITLNTKYDTSVSCCTIMIISYHTFYLFSNLIHTTWPSFCQKNLSMQQQNIVLKSSVYNNLN